MTRKYLIISIFLIGAVAATLFYNTTKSEDLAKTVEKIKTPGDSSVRKSSIFKLASAVSAMPVDEGAEYVRVILEELTDEDPVVKRAAAQSLGKIAVRASESEAALILKIKSLDGESTMFAIDALKTSFGFSEKYEPVLSKVLDDTSSRIAWQSALDFLSTANRLSSSTLKSIKTHLSEPDFMIASSAAKIILKHDPCDSSLISYFRKEVRSAEGFKKFTLNDMIETGLKSSCADDYVQIKAGAGH